MRRGVGRVGIGFLGLAVLVVLASTAAHAMPARLSLPDWDVSIGVSTGVAFDETGTTGHIGALFGVDVGLLHDVFGLHAGIRTHREGLDWRLGGYVEATAWYVLLLGLGVRFGEMLADGGDGVPDTEVGLTVLVAAPFSIARLDEGRDGSLIIVPYIRPGLRFVGAEDIVGFHEVGLMVRWSSWGW
ncbi:MAG: hypothetical protein ACI9MR_002827 [Myxococcota bacterium]|jgi:hypothetical protein